MPQIESIGFLVANDPDKGPGMHMHMRKWNPLCAYSCTYTSISRIWDLICTYMCACMDRIGQSEQGPRYPQGLPRQRLFHPWVLERRLCCRHACMCMYVYAHMHTCTHAHTLVHTHGTHTHKRTNTHTGMEPQEGDIVIKGKRGLDAFPGTDLEAQLLKNGIKTVVCVCVCVCVLCLCVFVCVCICVCLSVCVLCVCI